MMAAWMVAATLFAALLGVAALAADRALRMAGREARGVWALALGAAVCWPAIAPAAASFVAGLAHRESRTAVEAVGTALATAGAAIPQASRGWIAWVDVALLTAWAIASLVLFARLLWAMRILANVERSADREVIDGVPVLVTPALGPAVFGTRRARVLIPKWLLELDEPLRALVLRHEQEHCRARDPQVTLALAAAAVLMPWNAGVWWIARRLRLAVELDCDQRVLRGVEDPERYSKLLLFIAQRQSLVRLAPMLAESNSHLSRRIAAMNSPRPAHGRARVAVLAAVAVVVLAYSTRFASELTAAPSVTIPQATAPANRPAITVRDGDRVVMAVPGSAMPRYPESLKAAGVEGSVLVAFVVDTVGTADPSTIKVIARSDPLLAEAVRAAVPRMSFLPATLNFVKVKQAVRQPFIFNLFSASRKTSGDYGAAVAKLLSDAGPSPFYTLSPVIVTGVLP